jgi:hypothetical protein
MPRECYCLENGPQPWGVVSKWIFLMQLSLISNKFFLTLYRQPNVRYQVEYPNNPLNELACMDDGIGNLCVLANSIVLDEEEGHDGILTMYFYGSHSKTRTSAGIVLYIQNSHSIKSST